MPLQYSPKNNPRVIIIQKLYGKFFNDDEKLDFPKHRFKKFIKDVVSGTIERNEILTEESLSKLEEIYLSIGPEGGFSPKEIDKMRSNGLEGISLGDLVIKTETVPTVLLSMLKILNK